MRSLRLDGPPTESPHAVPIPYCVATPAPPPVGTLPGGAGWGRASGGCSGPQRPPQLIRRSEPVETRPRRGGGGGPDRRLFISSVPCARSVSR